MDWFRLKAIIKPLQRCRRERESATSRLSRREPLLYRLLGEVEDYEHANDNLQPFANYCEDTSVNDRAGDCGNRQRYAGNGQHDGHTTNALPALPQCNPEHAHDCAIE